MRVFFQRHFFKVTLVFLLVFGFILRFYGLSKNYSFWTDEASTARFAEGVVETGIPKSLATGYIVDAYYTTHYLTALSFKIFGISELSARLPEVIFGTLLIAVVYLLGKKIFNQGIGLGAALFTTFSYVQIAWSRQARGYTIFEVFFILSLYFLFKFFGDKKKLSLILLIVSSLLTVLTHTLGFVLMPIIFIYWASQGNIRKIIFNGKTYLLAAGVLALFFILPISKNLLIFLFNYKITNLLGGKTFISYYHALFWRQYSLFSFLGFIGLLFLLLKKEKAKFWLLFSSLSIYLIMTSIFLHVPFEKYSLAVFPLLFILSSFSLFNLAQTFFSEKKYTILIYFCLVLFIILNGNKFSFKPRSFFTLNYDMKEIPEIDYKKIYNIVREKSSEVGRERVAVIDIDEDIPAWYLGEKGNYFNPRNDVLGETKSLGVGAEYIHSLDDLINVYKKYPYGFVFLIEHNFRFYPEGMVDWARKNLNLEEKESYAAFAPDWIYWPVELYSWGFGNGN